MAFCRRKIKQFHARKSLRQLKCRGWKTIRLHLFLENSRWGWQNDEHKFYRNYSVRYILKYREIRRSDINRYLNIQL